MEETGIRCMWWATVLLFLHVKRSKAACKVAKKCFINSAKMHQNAFRFFSQVGTYQDRLASWSKLSWLRFLFDFLQLRRFFDDLRGLLTFARHLLQLSPVDVSLLGSFDVHRSTAAVAQPICFLSVCAVINSRKGKDQPIDTSVAAVFYARCYA